MGKRSVAFQRKFPTNVGQWGYSGISTPGHLRHERCLADPSIQFNIAVLGIPFDTVASYRPGRHRVYELRGFGPYPGINPYMSWAQVLDCGDIPVTPSDNDLALQQVTEALQEMGIELDTLHTNSYPSLWSSPQSDSTHGSMFWLATKEGLIQNGTSVHAGLRTRLTGAGWEDRQRDDEQGFLRLTTEGIDEIGPQGIVDRIIRGADVLDPGFAPGTGAPELGGWRMRKVNRISRGLRPVNTVGADIVEVSPANDDKGESTAFVAAQIAYKLITN
ncbi:hypothetical protein BDV39DRAFT_192541 [Aspergillus sergii]|uniref:Arginase family-domain-containing protein n=1 Tax=Aspergillus sergii TaxID=1034303 RepID=A0A5N6X4M3_9EURO|nr:hypothetical protein BDV39DRAFT_192541 [Aspergillus sergii]